MPVTVDEPYVRNHFQSLGSGDYPTFFAHVSPTVDWTAMGSHALSGHYTSIQQFNHNTAERLNPRMQNPLQLKLTGCVVDGTSRRAAVELNADGVQKSGKRFDNKYCWVVQYDEEGVITTVRAYLDGELVNQAINENAGP